MWKTLAVAATVLSLATSATAQTQTVCSDRASFLAQLNGRYHENPVALGLAGQQWRRARGFGLKGRNLDHSGDAAERNFLRGRYRRGLARPDTGQRHRAECLTRGTCSHRNSAACNSEARA